MYETSIPLANISETDLTDLIGKLSKLTGQDVQIDKVFIVTTDNVNLSSLLDDLAEGIKTAKPRENWRKAVGSQSSAKKSKATKASEKSRPAEKLGPRSMRIVTTGEVISTRELKRRLTNKLIDELTTIENGKGVRFVVIDGKLAKEPKAGQ